MKWCTGVVLSAFLLAGVGAWAHDAPLDRKSEKERKEKEWKELEKAQKGPQGRMAGGVNPLKKILELMRSVEKRIEEADTGEFTQEEQKQIVEAMKFQGDAKRSLDELIRKIEEMQQQCQQCGGNSSDQQKKKESDEERKRREDEERKRREKEEEKRRQLQKPDQQKKKDQQSQDPQKRRKDQKPPPDEAGARKDPPSDAERWGDLPAKLHQDARRAADTPLTERFRKLIEAYRRKRDGE